MAKDKVSYQCAECQYISPSYLGKCPECQSWSSLVEIRQKKAAPAAASDRRSRIVSETGAPLPAVPLSQVQAEKLERYSSGFPELDRVLGGGILPGAYILLGGDPGIGKSTLMLQVADRIGQAEKSVLYIAGEESPYQIKLRAERLGLAADRILVLPETNITLVAEAIQGHRPDFVVIDSIQSMYNPEIASNPGSVAQIRECAGALMGVAKSLNVTILLVGHVTKEGAVSGPKLLEHTVDTVLYFEGEKYRNLRLLRTVKNRFGGVQEVGVFEMDEEGLHEVTNPSELFLSESRYQNVPGSVIVSTVEGTRPLLVELQALVGKSAYSTPRRVATGVEISRLHQIVAVLERRVGLDVSSQDIYVNVVGGMHIDEPAADLAIALAIITSYRNLSVKPGTVVAGEIGLTGEIRSIRQWESRLSEAQKLGFKRMVLPKPDPKSRLVMEQKYDIEVVGIRTILDALSATLTAMPAKPGGEKAYDVEGEEPVPR